MTTTMTQTTRHHSEPRLPAEWEPHGAVLVAWPHPATDWNYMLPEVEACYTALIETISRHAAAIVIAPDTARPRALLADVCAGSPYPVIFFDVPTNDTWTRDYGVITTIGPDGNTILNDFGFNAWGGKFASELDNAVTAAMTRAGLLRGEYTDRRSLILEGGSIESDGRGTLLVTEECLLTPTRNPQLTRTEIEGALRDSLGARKVLWAHGGGIVGDDTDGHIDTLARLAPGNIILHATPCVGTPDAAQGALLEAFARSLEGMTDASGEPYSLLGIPLPEPIYDPADGSRLPATYLNYLILNDALLMPVYGQPMADMLAQRIVRIAFPDHTIETVDCRALIRQHGSLHCATMQIPSSALPI